MKEYQDTEGLLSLLRNAEEYYKLKKELDAARGRAEHSLSPSFDAARAAVGGICGSDKFISILKKLCYVYSELLSFDGEELRYRGRAANVPTPTEEGVNDEAKRWERE